MNFVRKHSINEVQTDFEILVPDHPSSTNDDMESSISTARTVEVMDICKIKIIKPFNVMLTMVGWRSLSLQMQCSEKYSLTIRILDKALLLVLLLFLIFSYVYQVLACRFTMNIEDKIIDPITTMAPRHNASTFTWINLVTPTFLIRNVTDDSGSYMLCKHLSTTYVIPNLIHFIAFILGILHYRIRENEDIYGLMEKTLQYSATLGIRRNNYFVVSKMMTLWMAMAVLWVILAIINHIFYDVIFNAYMSPVYIFKIKPTDDYFTSNIKHLMFIFDFIGYIIMSVVTATIVLNYTIYCELVKFYVDAISTKIETRRIKLSVLRNDINNVGGAINLINGMIGKMMSLIFFFKLNLLIVGINNVIQGVSKSNQEIAFRFYYVLHILPLVLTALFQCVRVNNAVKTFRKWGRHMSVFGYRKSTKKELDSFLLFTMGYNCKARLMAIPLEYWQLMILFVSIALVFITLIQTSVMDNVPIIKYM